MTSSRAWLPSESASRARARGIVACLLLALGTLLVLNAAAGELVAKAGSNLGYGLMDAKWRMAMRGSPGAAVVVIGDSAGNQGVDPEVLSATLPGGPRVVNLCTVANGLAVHDAWILRQWIDSSGRPPLGVVVVHTFDMWHRNPDATDSAAIFARVAAPLWTWGRFRPALRVSAGAWRTLLLSRWAPMYASDQTLREMIADPAGTWVRYSTGRGVGWRNIDERGFMEANRAAPERVENDARGHERFLRRVREFHPSPENVEAMEELAAMAREQGFPVWVAAAPLYRGLGEDEAFIRYQRGIRAWLESFERQHPEVRIVWPEPFLLDSDELQNADHATASGARRYTRAVGEAIARVWGGRASAP